jgi:VWFA-related protein
VDATMESIRMLSRRPKDHRRVLLLISETRDKGSEIGMREALTYAQVNNIIIYTVNMSRFLNAASRKPDLPRPAPIPPEARVMPGGVAATPTNTAQVYGAPGYSANFAPLIKELFTQVKAIFVDNHAEVLTKYTGGSEYGFTSQRDLERAIQNLGEELHSQYLISYTPNNRMEGGWHSIRVEVLGRSDLKISTRPGYWLAAVPY